MHGDALSSNPGHVFLDAGQHQIQILADNVVFSGFSFHAGVGRSDGGFLSSLIRVRGSHNLVTQCDFDGYFARKYIDIAAGTQYNNITYCHFANKPPHPVNCTNVKMCTAPGHTAEGNLIQITPHPTVLGHHRVAYCAFRNLSGAGGDFGNEPIRLGYSHTAHPSRTIIEHCYFSDVGGADDESISVRGMGGTVEGDCRGACWATLRPPPPRIHRL